MNEHVLPVREQYIIAEKVANKAKRIEELEREMEAPGYWDDPEKSQEGITTLKNLKDEAEDYHALEMIVDKEMWPMPSYGDLMFEV